jgi:hypothetical protein
LETSRDPEGAYSLVSDEVKVPNGITCVGDRLFVNEMRMNGRLLELFPEGGDPVVLTGGLAFGNAMQLGPDGWLYSPHMISGQVWRVSPDGGVPEVVAEDVHDPVAVRFDQGGVLHVLSRVEAEDLAVGSKPRPAPALFAHGLPGVAPEFAGLTTAPDGSLLLSSNGEGTVVRLSPARPGT